MVLNNLWKTNHFLSASSKPSLISNSTGGILPSTQLWLGDWFTCVAMLMQWLFWGSKPSNLGGLRSRMDIISPYTLWLFNRSYGFFTGVFWDFIGKSSQIIYKWAMLHSYVKYSEGRIMYLRKISVTLWVTFTTCYFLSGSTIDMINIWVQPEADEKTPSNRWVLSMETMTPPETLHVDSNWHNRCASIRLPSGYF